MLSLSGICAKQLKDQGRLPEKFNDLACEPILQDVGECYLGTHGYPLYTGKSVPYSNYQGLTLMTPYGTDLCTSGIANFSKEWEIETYFTVTQLNSNFLYRAIEAVFNTKSNTTCSVDLTDFSGSSGYHQVKITEPGTYGAKIFHEKNSKLLKFYYSFNGSDFKFVCNSTATDFNFTKKPYSAVKSYLGLGKADSYAKGRYIHNLSGTKLTVDGKVLFYRA